MIILFTGINGELGKSFAKNFGQTYKIIGIGRNKECQAENVHDYISFDLNTDGEKIETLIDFLGDKYSFKEIKGIVHSAVQYYFEEIYLTDSNPFANSLNLNVIAPQIINKVMVNGGYMGKNKGNIIHLGSFSGKGIYPKSMVYSTTKAALNMLMRYEVEEYKRFGIKINMVVPTTFPKLVATDVVASEVEKLLHTEQTGKTVYVDSNRIWTE